MTLLPIMPDLHTIRAFFQHHAPAIGQIADFTMLAETQSERTWRLVMADKEYILRQVLPATPRWLLHPLAREFRVLTLLRKHCSLVPKPVLHCEDPAVAGAPFYLLEQPPGVALPALRELSPGLLQQLNASWVDQLVALHAIDIETTGLVQLGHAEGYTERQVSGWIQRYRQYQTDTLPVVDYVAQWLSEHMPVSAAPTLLHNNYRLEHLRCDPLEWTRITGITEWNLGTVGDPLMDVGILLANWGETGDPDGFRAYLPGQPSRQELSDRYGSRSGRYMSNIVFYYVFGMFRNAVIMQHHYHHWKQQHRWQQPGPLAPRIIRLAEETLETIERGRL